MATRWTTLVIAALLAVVLADLSIGKGNLPYVMGLRRQLAAQLAGNAQARERNARVAAEVSDLKEGLEMVEEKARHDLGMLRPDEILVQVSAERAPTQPAGQAMPPGQPPLQPATRQTLPPAAAQR